MQDKFGTEIKAVEQCERECEHCGCPFLGEPGQTICSVCSVELNEERRRDAEWQAEMRRDAFGD